MPVKPSPRLGLLLCLTLAGLAAGAARPAFAQVTVDLHALDAQPGGANPSETPAPAPAHKPPPHRIVPRRTEAKPPVRPKTAPPEQATTQPAHPAEPATPMPAVGSAAPPPPKMTTPSPAPAAPPAPPAAVIGLTPPPAAVIPPPPAADAPMAPVPPPTISADAGTTLAALPPKNGTGLRLDFAHDESALTQATADAVKALVAAAPKTDTTTYDVLAYATGVPQDPSAARRVSLSRALSVRSALMAYGVPSTHIYVRALGAQAGDGPPDRVDVTVLGTNDTAASTGTPAATPVKATP
jgi:outer membrane protein OmpA-like peptidoglycan-associated protein